MFCCSTRSALKAGHPILEWFASFDETESDSRPTDAAVDGAGEKEKEQSSEPKTVVVATTEATADAMADEPDPVRCYDCEDAALAPLTPSNLRLIAAGSDGSAAHRRDFKGDDLHSETCSQTSKWSHSTGGALQRSMDLQAGSPGLKRATTGFGWGAGRTTGALKNMDELDELTEAAAVAVPDEARVDGDLEVD